MIAIKSRSAIDLRPVAKTLTTTPLLNWKDHALLALIGIFVAYVLGVAAILDPARGVAGRLVRLIDRRRGSWTDYKMRSQMIFEEVRDRFEREEASNETREAFNKQAEASKYWDYRTSKARLLTHKESLFLACDKLDAEAALRLSSALPLMAGSALSWSLVAPPWPAFGLALGVSLFVRGLGRALEARDTVRDAVAAGVAPHPLTELAANFPFKSTDPASE